MKDATAKKKTSTKRKGGEKPIPTLAKMQRLQKEVERLTNRNKELEATVEKDETVIQLLASQRDAHATFSSNLQIDKTLMQGEIESLNKKLSEKESPEPPTDC